MPVRFLTGTFGCGIPGGFNDFDTMIAGEIVNGKDYGEEETGDCSFGVSTFTEVPP